MSLILLGILNSQAAAAGGAPAYDLLETQTLGTASASVSFTGIDTLAADYKHLQFRIVARTDRAAQDFDISYINFNNDTGSNYAAHRLNANATTINQAANTSVAVGIGALIPAAGDSVTDNYAGAVVDILDFQNTNKYTTLRSLFGSTGDDDYVGIASTVWMNTAIVDEVGFTAIANYTAGSRFSLYGIRGA